MLHIHDQDLTSLNTLGLHSRARALVRYSAVGQLPLLTQQAARYGKVMVLGGGSNVVLAPLLDCLVVKVESQGIRVLDESDDAWIIEAQAGEVWHDLVAHCVGRGWNGLENLALIPGTVGAAPVQNIGAYGVELDQRFHSLTAWDLLNGRQLEMGPEDCRFSYRNSFFKQSEPGRWLITALRLRLPKAWRPALDYPDLRDHPMLQAGGAAVSARRIFDAVCEVRRRKLPDPAVLGNAGSFFKNPIVDAAAFDAVRKMHPDVVAYAQDDGRAYKLAAGWLIDRAGWKGRRMGRVGVHDRQALVLVNYGGADARDIAQLAGAIKADIQARFGVMLEQEPVQVC
ncbi:UDP-N-acetylmuramate dehydrogenase [Pollutimonas sp. H1-120]|uniref:UDP-N-acetylmuramate dehydrogenase n=1 Tax=Pollutimonas sp. H1-120 TaxID=3148824 RepID=UPI003B52579F